MINKAIIEETSRYTLNLWIKPDEKICYGSNAPTFSAMLFKKFLEDRVLARSCNLEGRPLCISLIYYNYDNDIPFCSDFNESFPNINEFDRALQVSPGQ